MIAVYSEIVFGDTSLYASALAAHRRRSSRSSWRSTCPGRPTACSVTAPQVRAPVDALTAGAPGAGIASTTIAGVGPMRLAAALRAIDEVRERERRAAKPSRRGGRRR